MLSPVVCCYFDDDPKTLDQSQRTPGMELCPKNLTKLKVSFHSLSHSCHHRSSNSSKLRRHLYWILASVSRQDYLGTLKEERMMKKKEQEMSDDFLERTMNCYYW